MKENVIYCGEINKNENPWVFRISEIPIVKVHPLFYEVEHYYFISPHFSTKNFDTRYMDDECIISDKIRLFYSLNKDAVKSYLEIEYRREKTDAEYYYRHMESAKLDLGEPEKEEMEER